MWRNFFEVPLYNMCRWSKELLVWNSKYFNLVFIFIILAELFRRKRLARFLLWRCAEFMGKSEWDVFENQVFVWLHDRVRNIFIFDYNILKKGNKFVQNSKCRWDHGFGHQYRQYLLNHEKFKFFNC